MTKAEERGYEAYPYFPTEVNLFGHETITADGNTHDRAIYIKGYEQAEKDIHKEIAEIMEKHKETLHTDYDIHIEPVAGSDAVSVIIYNNMVIEQLTWKDIRDIVRTADGLMYMAESLCDTEKRLGVQTYYKEVLRKFKAIKKGK